MTTSWAPHGLTGGGVAEKPDAFEDGRGSKIGIQPAKASLTD